MKKLHLLAFAAVLASASLAACGGDDGDPAATGATGAATDDSAAASGGAATGEMTEINLTLQWVTQAQFAGYYAALEQGYYEEEGIDLTIQPGGPDINPIQLLVSGDTDIAIQQFGAVLAARETGADLKSIGQVFERGAYRLVSFADRDITSGDQIKGKTVGLWNGFQPAFSATAGKYSLDLDTDVEIFNQGFDMVAFLDGQIDMASAMTYNEYAQALAGAEGREISVFDFNEEGTATLEDTITTTGAWLDANPDAAVGFLKATAKGWIYCRDNPEECVQIVLENGTALPENFQTWQMNEVNKLLWPSTNGVLNLTDDMFSQTADILLKYEVIKEAASEEAYDMSFRDKAVAELSEEDVMGASFKPLELDPAELFG
ncbi:MAG: ABC transporter substrate-binding protein [Acidimicrobiales bacterium]